MNIYVERYSDHWWNPALIVAVLRIRIRLEPSHFGQLDLHKKNQPQSQEYHPLFSKILIFC